MPRTASESRKRGSIASSAVRVSSELQIIVTLPPPLRAAIRSSSGPQFGGANFMTVSSLAQTAAIALLPTERTSSTAVGGDGPRPATEAGGPASFRVKRNAPIIVKPNESNTI